MRWRYCRIDRDRESAITVVVAIAVAAVATAATAATVVHTASMNVEWDKVI